MVQYQYRRFFGLSLKDLPPVCTRLGKCTYCPLLHKISEKNSEFKSPHTGKTHKTRELPDKHRITCEIYNVIYIIHCSSYQKIHCGKTSRQMRKIMYATAKNLVIKWNEIYSTQIMVWYNINAISEIICLNAVWKGHSPLHCFTLRNTDYLS